MATLRTPMEGLKVVDFSTMVAGPWATRLMADCGAEVVKIESVGDGDGLRHVQPVVDGMSRVFAQFNCGKKSVALDLKKPADLTTARRLIAEADVLVENFRPGVMQRLGLGYAEAAADNPRLIYCSISGFGQDGPLANVSAYGPVVQAMAGFDLALMASRGETGEPPASGVMIADVVAATYAFGAVQSALLRRERFGGGSYVDVSLIESTMSLLGIQYQEAQAARPKPSSYIFRSIKTADGYVVAPLVSPRSYQALFAVIGRPAWVDDETFSSQTLLSRRRRDIEDLLGVWCKDRPSADCQQLLNAAGVPCGAHIAPKEALHHPHLRQRGSFAPIQDAEGTFVVLNTPFRLKDTGCAPRPQVARLGQHNADVIAALRPSVAAPPPHSAAAGREQV